MPEHFVVRWLTTWGGMLEDRICSQVEELVRQAMDQPTRELSSRMDLFRERQESADKLIMDLCRLFVDREKMHLAFRMKIWLALIGILATVVGGITGYYWPH